MATRQLAPDRIMQLGFGFWGSKTLLTAVELGLFTELAKKSLDAKTLTKRLKLHSRSALDFFDTLVALGMLNGPARAMPTLLRPPCFWIAPNPPMPAACSKWSTPGSILSGDH